MLISKSIFHENAISELVFDLLHDISKTPEAMSVAPCLDIANSEEFVSKINCSIANVLVLIYVNLYAKTIEGSKNPHDKLDFRLLKDLLKSKLVDAPTRNKAALIFDFSVKSRLNISGVDDSYNDFVSISYGRNRDASFSFYSIIKEPDLLALLLQQKDYLLFDSIVMQSAMKIITYEIDVLSDYLSKNPSKKKVDIFDDSITNFLPMAAKYYGEHGLKCELIKLLDAVKGLEKLYGGLAPQISKCLSSCAESISISYSTARYENSNSSDIPRPADHEIAIVDMERHMLESRDALINSIYDAPGGPDKVEYMSFGCLSKDDFLRFIEVVCEIREEPYPITRCIKETINAGFKKLKLNKSCIDEIIDLAEKDSSSLLMRQSVTTALAESGKYDLDTILRCIRSPQLVEFGSLLIDSSRGLSLPNLNKIISVAKKFSKLYSKSNAKYEWCARMAEITAHERIASCHIYPDIKSGLNQVPKKNVITLFDWAIKNNRVTKEELALLAKSMSGNYDTDAYQDLLIKIKCKSTDLYEHLIGHMLREKTNSLQEPLRLSNKQIGRFAL